MPRTAIRSATRTVLGGAALLLALGNAGCTNLLGIEELKTSNDALPPAPGGDAAPGNGDAAAPVDAAAPGEDAASGGSEYLGYHTDYVGRIPLFPDMVWAAPIRVTEARMLDELGVILHLNGEPSVNLKLDIYIDLGGKPGERYATGGSALVTQDGDSNIDVDDVCLSSGDFWLVIRVDRQNISIGSSDDGASDLPIYFVSNYPYSTDLPDPFIDGLAWAEHSKRLISAYFVVDPLQTSKCPFFATSQTR